MGLKSHLSCVYDDFSSYHIPFSSTTSLTMMGLGPGNLVRALFHFFWELHLVRAQSLSDSRHIIRDQLVNPTDCALDDLWDELVLQQFCGKLPLVV